MTENGQAPGELRRILETLTDLDVPLEGRLTAYSQAVHQYLPDVEAAYNRLVQRISDNGAAEYAPGIGDELPDGVLPDTDGHLVRLTALLAAGPLVVSSNRGAWCGYCCLELNALSGAYLDITALGAHAVAIVPESEEYARALKQTCGPPFSVLVDRNLGFALSMGLVFWLGQELKDTI